MDLLKYYYNEKEKLINQRLTEKKYNELIRIEKELKKRGLLPLTLFDTKWKRAN